MLGGHQILHRAVQRRALRCLIGITAIAILAGCGSLIELSKSGPAPSLYNLRPPAGMPDYPGATSPLFLFGEPTAVGGLNTNRVARRPVPTELQYFAAARWTERLPLMVESVFVEAFEASGVETISTRESAGIPADYRIQIEIRAFEAEFYGGATRPDVHVRLMVKIVRLGPLEVVASKDFAARVEANGGQLPPVIDAFETAMRSVVEEAIVWVGETLE